MLNFDTNITKIVIVIILLLCTYKFINKLIKVIKLNTVLVKNNNRIINK